MEFDFLRLLLIIICSIGAFFVASNKMESKQKTLLLFCYLFVTIYSGIGGALKKANTDYTLFYILYLAVLSITIRISNISIDYSRDTKKLSSFVDRHANSFIIIYFLIVLSSFIYPEVKISNLISPPLPTLTGFDFEEEGNNYGGGAFASIIYLLKNIFLPFFFIGLYKYKDKPIKVVFLLFLDLYFTYCDTGYVGRGTILQTAIIIFFIIYYRLSPRQKRLLLISIAASIPFILFGFYRYSLVRVGTDVSGESLSQAMDILFGQEIGYPLHFDSYIKLTRHHIGDYLEWLLLLPLPGFLKFGYGEYFLNREFSIEILGLDPSNSYFFVVLPGVVGESIYVFGPYLFWIHAIILGIVIKFVIKTFTSNDIFSYLYYFCIVYFSFMLARAGTISVYPTMMKSFLTLIIVFYFVKNSVRRSKV